MSGSCSTMFAMSRPLMLSIVERASSSRRAVCRRIGISVLLKNVTQASRSCNGWLSINSGLNWGTKMRQDLITTDALSIKAWYLWLSHPASLSRIVETWCGHELFSIDEGKHSRHSGQSIGTIKGYIYIWLIFQLFLTFYLWRIKQWLLNVLFPSSNPMRLPRM